MTVLSCCLLSAAWIAGSYEMPPEVEYGKFFADAPAPVLRREFALAGEVEKGTWSIAAAGLVDAYVNGERVTPTAIPGWTDFASRVLVYDYDVTRFLKRGENVLELRLGNGWYNLLPMKMWGRYNLRENLAQGTPCVHATLDVATKGGVTKVETDGRWQSADGPILRNSIYIGERADARRMPSGWRPARVVDGPKGVLTPAGTMPKVVVYRRWKAKKVTEPKPGLFVADFGENFAGNLRMVFRNVRSGQEISMRYGELLNADGTVNVMTTVAGQQKNAAIDPPGIACQSDSLVCSDAAELVYEPRFTFHTFRYAEFHGIERKPDAEDFEALAYSADVADSSSFVCSDARLNEMREMCRRTFRANLQGVQSDCPARERFGYGGDLAATAESFILNYDMHGFYRKVLRDRCDSAARNGGVPTSVSPSAFPKSTIKSVKMGWVVDIPIVVDLLVRYYGDTDVVGEVYPTLKRFLDLREKSFSPEDTPKCIGDHEAIDKADQQTTAMCHYHQFLKLAAKFARRLGETSDAARYDATAARLEAIFAERARYVPARGFVGNGRQGEEVFAIYHGMLPQVDLDAAYKLLRYDVVAHDNALSTGMFGPQYLLDVLTERGDAELAGKVVMHEGFPGWLNMLDHGATTLWESWIGSDDIYSHCHPMFGSVAGWMMKGIVGIKVCEDAVGCDKVRIEPHAVPGVSSASGWLDTPRGRISVSWRLEDGKMVVEKDVPAGVVVVGDDVRARPVWVQDDPSAENRSVSFRTFFDWEAGPNPTLELSASSVYRATLNGEFIGWGPARTVHGAARKDRYSLNARPGRNVLVVEVAGYNVESFQYEGNRPFLLAEVRAQGKALAVTPGNFEAVDVPRRRDTPVYSRQRGFASESYEIDMDWDSWCRGGSSSRPRLEIVEAEMPQWLEREVPYPDFAINSEFQETTDAKGGLMWKLKNVDSGLVGLRVHCRKQGRIAFEFDEALGTNGVVDLSRNGDPLSSWHACYNRLVWDVKEPGEYTLETIEPYTMRFARVVGEGGEFENVRPYLRQCRNPLVGKASFSSSDPELDALFRAAKESLAQNAVDILTDCPSRERVGWLCDTFFSSEAAAWLTGDFSMEREYLLNFVRTDDFGENIPSGTVPGFAPSRQGGVMPTYMMWYVIQCMAAADRMGVEDRADFISRVGRRIGGIFRWLEKFEKGGLLEDLPGWVFIEWSRANDYVKGVNFPANTGSLPPFNPSSR